MSWRVFGKCVKKVILSSFRVTVLKEGFLDRYRRLRGNDLVRGVGLEFYKFRGSRVRNLKR